MSDKLMQPEEIKDMALKILDDMKGDDITVLDVHQLTDVTDFMIIASGTSSRHVKSMAGEIRDQFRDLHGIRPIGVEGENEGDWVLIDLGDIVVHIMRPQTREFYNLEKLWSSEVEELVRLNRDNQDL